MSAWLEDELAAYAGALTLPGLMMLRKAGLSAEDLAAVTGGIGRARVGIEHGLWLPQAGGAARLVIAVRERGVLVDLVAVTAADSDAGEAGDVWHLRTGRGVLLGMDAWEWAIGQQGPDHAVRVRLFSTPLAWLIGQGASARHDDALPGICVLDWGREGLAYLRNLGPQVSLVCDTIEAAEALHEQLRWGALPQVETRSRFRRAA